MGEKSLRGVVEKLLGAAGAQPVRILLTHRSQSGRTRRVCVEVQRPGGPLALFFFRHNDGTWHVFPPGAARPSMSVAGLPLDDAMTAQETTHG